MDSRQRWKEKNPNYQKDYYDKNKDKITEQKRLCREAKKEEYAAVAKERYALKRDHILSLSRERREANPGKTLLNLARARAKKKGLPFNIDISDINIPEICPLLNMPIIPSKECVAFNSPTLDRIIPELGYVKGNVWVVSMRANFIKSNASLADLKLIVSNLEKKQNNE